ncbi:MAG: hypothetical protein JWN70_1433, partial [Planctomycetaceae bacterium]|nr:hypothetical protein [Planctomycetaceae bacterium]
CIAVKSPHANLGQVVFDSRISVVVI